MYQINVDTIEQRIQMFLYIANLCRKCLQMVYLTKIINSFFKFRKMLNPRHFSSFCHVRFLKVRPSYYFMISSPIYQEYSDNYNYD